jgi:hypothetical protein
VEDVIPEQRAMALENRPHQTPVTSALFSWTLRTPMLSLSVDEALKVSPQGFPD